MGSAFFLTLTYAEAPKRYHIPSTLPESNPWHPPFAHHGETILNLPSELPTRKKHNLKYHIHGWTNPTDHGRVAFFKGTKRLTADYYHLQNFMKLLRFYNKSKKIKFYAVSEYGDHTYRPHYHVIIMGIDILSFIGVDQWEKYLTGHLPMDGETPYIVDSWPHGHITLSPCTPATVNYTLKYISKGRKIPQYKDDDRQPEKSLMSKNMGLAWLTPQMKKAYQSNPEGLMHITTSEGIKIPIPRYYRERLFDSLEREELNKIIQQRHYQKISEMGEIERARYLRLNRQQIPDDTTKNTYKHKGKI